MAFDTSIFGEEYASIKDEEQAGASVGAISVSQQQQNRDPVADLFGDDYGAAPASAAGVDPVADMFGEDYAAPSLPQQQAAVVTKETQDFRHPADVAAEEQVKQVVSAKAEEDEDTFWSSTGKGLMRGLAAIPQAIGTAVKSATGTISAAPEGQPTDFNTAFWQGVKETGETIADYYQGVAEKYQPKGDYTQSVVDKPSVLLDSRWWGSSIGELAPGLAASFLPAGAIAKLGGLSTKAAYAIKLGDKAIPLTTRAIAALARLSAAATGGALEGAGAYEEAKRRGADDATAAKAFGAMTLMVGVLNGISLGKFMEGSRLGSAFTEALTEYLEEPTKATIQKVLGLVQEGEPAIWNSFKEGLNVVPVSFLLGALGGAKGVKSEAPTAQVTDQALEKPAAPATPQQAALEILKNKGVAKKTATLTAKQTPEMQRVSELSKATVGKEIIFVDGLEQNGLYDPEQPDKIFIDSKAENPMVVVFGHEVTHGIKQDDPESYNELRNVVINEIGADGWNKWVARRKEQAAAGRAFDEADLEGNQEEFIADFVGENAGKKSFWQGVYDKSPRAFQALIDIVNKMWVKLKSGTKTFEAKEGYDTAQFFQSVEGLERARNTAMEVMRRQMERRYGFRMRADAGAPEFTGTTREQFQAERPVREGEGLVPYYGQYAQTSRALRPESADARRKVEASIKAELDAKTYRELVTEAKKLGMTKFPLNTKGLREAITMARKFIEMSEVRKQNQYLKEQEDATRIRGDEGQVPVARAVAEAGEEAGGDDIQRQAAQVEEARGKVGGVKESARIVTDDAGNVIPLSERFNEESPDIRFSSRLAPLESEKLPETEQELDQQLQAIRMPSPIWEFLKLVGTFESNVDKLRKAGAYTAANRIRGYYDAARRNMGKIHKELFEAREAIPRGEKAKAFKTHFDFFAAGNFGREAQARAIYDAAPKHTKDLIDSTRRAYQVIGDLAEKLKVQVRDAKTGKMRNFKKRDAEFFFNRMFRPEVRHALANPGNNPKLYEKLFQALKAAGKVKTIEDMAKWKNEYFSDVRSSDFNATLELGRGEALPEIFYDFSPEAAAGAMSRAADRLAQIEAFGQTVEDKQNPRKDWWDTNLPKISDKNTRNALQALREDIYNIRLSSSFHKFMNFLNLIATGFHLANPMSAFNNLVGGTATGASTVGLVRMMKAYGQMMLDPRGSRQFAIGEGVTDNDQMRLFRDTENTDLLDPEDKIIKWTGKIVSAGLNISGYNKAERLVRTATLLGARSVIADGLAAYNENPGSRRAKQFKDMVTNTYSLDFGKIVQEGGVGEETSKLYREMVNSAQGSYQLDQVPPWMNTPAGRFFFKYMKFGSQVNRMFYETQIKPFTRNPTPENFYRIMRFMANGVAAGAIVGAARGMIGTPPSGPDTDDIKKALENEDKVRALSLFFQKVWESFLVGGLGGNITNTMQMAKDWRDRQRVKNPMQPPGFAMIDLLSEIVNRWHEQGKLTGRDIDEIAEKVSAYRVNKRISLKALSTIGADFEEVKRFDAKQDVAMVRKYTRQFAKETGLEGRRMTSGGRPIKTPTSPLNRGVTDALLIGEPQTARELIRQELKGKKAEERKKILASVKSAVRNRQPIVVGEGPSEENRNAFLRWAKKNVGDVEYQTIRKIDKDYRMSAKRAGLM